MHVLDIQTKVKIYDHPEELPEEEQTLVEKAKEALQDAYAPYSKFKVGAALLLEDSTIDTGSNQENASSPAGICAERVALSNRAANHPDKKILAIAISVDNDVANSPAAPCGICRQTLHEAEIRQGSKIKLLLKGPSPEVYVIDSVEALLPLPFSAGNLVR